MKPQEEKAASEAPVNNHKKEVLFMEYAINIRFFSKVIGAKKAAEFVAKAGFTQLDYTAPVRLENWETVFKEDIEAFKEYGLTVHQTHLPFNRYGTYKNEHKKYIDIVVDTAEQLGAKYFVAHGDEFDFENMKFSKEAALDYNYNLFLPYVERAKRNGYKLAFETVFEDWDRRRFTSDADELYNLINSYNSDAAVCCWDFGHANVSFGPKAPSVIERFGPLIQCTHLHDNTGVDAHQIPLSGDIDWKKTINAFKKIGYNGILSVEYAHGTWPEHLTEAFIDLTYKTAEYLWTL